MKDERPVNLDLIKFHFPVMAIVSIIHRITGVIIFLSIPALLYVLHASLISQASFSKLETCLAYPISKVVLIGILACAIYHLFAGLRHLIMDLGVGEGKTSARVTAWFVILLSIAGAVFIGVWLW